MDCGCDERHSVIERLRYKQHTGIIRNVLWYNGCKITGLIHRTFLRVQFKNIDIEGYAENFCIVLSGKWASIESGYLRIVILADKIHRIRDTLAYFKLHGICLSNPSRGRYKRYAGANK